MNPTNHPLSEGRAQALWDKREDDGGFRWNDLFRDQPTALAAMRAAYDAGREDALRTPDPLADLTPGTVIRDVEFDLEGRWRCDVALICEEPRGMPRRVHLPHGPQPVIKSLTAFTTDDRRTRYTRHGDTWTAETMKEDA